MLPRHLQAHIDTLLRHFPCVAVNGASQSGKTTLLANLSSDWQRFDMESATDRAQALADLLFRRLEP